MTSDAYGETTDAAIVDAVIAEDADEVSTDALISEEPPPVPVESDEKPGMFWVGIGASAGGLEALRGFVRNLPPVLPATFIVAQHMAPHHRSMLVEIIDRETDLPVRDVVDGMTPSANTVHIVPPNTNCMVDGDVLRLTEASPNQISPKPSVDVFFASLAESQGAQSIGVIFSGTGSDGSDGIRAIRKAGGITIAQDEATAKYSSMPVSALETDCVDLVMSPEELGTHLHRILNSPSDLSALQSSPVHLDSVSELVSLILDQTKVNFRHYKTATFQRRVERRMAAVNARSLDAYVEVAKRSSAEVDALYRDLLISVTSFFRDPSEFETINPFVEEIVREKNGSPIRVWVAGTATGEEAYSLAILFAEALGGLGEFERTSIQIFATDLDENAIEVARRAYYPETSLQEVPERYIEEYFERAPGGYTVKKSLREKVIFSVHNVTSDPPFLKIDLLSCRNLLIYFQTVLQAHVFARFHYSLVPHGVLFLGKSETVSAAETLFREAANEKHIFLQRPAANRAPLQDSIVTNPTRTMARPGGAQANYPPPEAHELAVLEARFESLIRGLGPNAILVSTDLNIIRVYGDVSDYVRISEGPISTSADTLLSEPFRQDVRVLVPGANRQRTVMQGLARAVPSDPTMRERVTAYPIVGGEGDEVLSLVVFSRWEDATTLSEGAAIDNFSEAAASTVEHLRRELSIVQTNLQHTSEELETSNEELQALNEELQSSNEELQSTNEELETSNEELQSTNEELSTVNEELQVNATQLNLANQSLRSILDNVAVPMIVVDRQLNITHASVASEQMFNVSPDLVLPHLSRCRLPPGFPSLTEGVERALSTSKRVEIVVDAEENSALISIVPHVQSSGAVIGAIIVVSDSTAALHERNAQLNAATRIAGVGYLTMDFVKDTAAWSSQMFQIAGADDDATYLPTRENLWGFELLRDESAVRVEAGLEKLRETATPFEIEVELVDLKGIEKALRMSFSPGLDAAGKVIGYLAVAIDISEQVDRERKLESTMLELSRSNEELNRFSFVCSHDMKEPVRMIETLSELLLDDEAETNAEQRKAILQRISSNMGRLRGTIDSLLAYSRIDAKVEESVIDLREVVSEMSESLSLVITEQDAEVIIGALPQMVGARIHFTQLFQNLIGNALKYSDKENPMVQVSSTETSTDVRIVVEDNGPGIPEEYRESIFNVFDRLHRQDEVDGVGLGLSICMRIVSQYNGSIECTQSELGGARFEMNFPKSAILEESNA